MPQVLALPPPEISIGSRQWRPSTLKSLPKRSRDTCDSHATPPAESKHLPNNNLRSFYQILAVDMGQKVSQSVACTLAGERGQGAIHVEHKHLANKRLQSTRV